MSPKSHVFKDLALKVALWEAVALLRDGASGRTLVNGGGVPLKKIATLISESLSAFWLLR
jgi:hypothetical protein